MSGRFKLHRAPSRTGSRLRGLALAAAIAGVAGPAVAADQYMTQGLPFFSPYRVGIATMDISGGKVTGTLAPPAGDPRPALPLSGTLSDGVLTLTIGTGPDTYTLSFNDGERGVHQVWDETVSIGDLDHITLFRPAAGFSDTALALQHMGDDWCGQVYGGLALVLRSSALKATPVAPPALADLEVNASSAARGSVKLKLKDLWSRLRLAGQDGDDISIDVAVPVGAEARTATALRAEPAVAAVVLPNGCTEMALAVIPKDKVSEKGAVAETKLKTYLQGVLNRFLSGSEATGTSVGGHKFKLSDVGVAKGADGVPVFTARVTAESEVTRLSDGGWDQFTLTVSPRVTATDTGATISLIPAITQVKTADKADAQMPAENAFAAADDDAVATAIAHRLVSWLATAEDTRCSFLTSAGFDEPASAYSCTNVALDGLPQADEN